MRGAKNPSAREKEIMRTRRRYKLGLLTPAEMDKTVNKEQKDKTWLHQKNIKRDLELLEQTQSINVV